MKFDHSKDTILKACGITKADMSKTINDTIKRLIELDDFQDLTLSDDERLAILVAVIGGSEAPVLSAVLSDITGRDMDSASSIIEYLFNELEEITVTKLLLTLTQRMLEKA